MTVTFDDISRASKTLEGVANRTPVHKSRTLDERAGSHVFLKCENFQRSGAFKFRGAYYALSQLDAAQKKAGVLTFSSGNHAQALALAGRMLGVGVTVVMPTDAPEVKRRATEGYGGEIVLYDRDETSREALGAQLAAERGLTVVPPYDHPHIVAGQGTAVKELLDEVGSLDYVFVPCGGGGLLSGSALSVRALCPSARVIGVEPATADDAARSFRSKSLVSVSNPDTVADGARTPSLGALTFRLVLENVDDILTVSDDDLLRQTHFLWERMKLVVEPTGALGLAGVMNTAPSLAGARVGVVVSGGNADFASLVGHWNRLGL